MVICTINVYAVKRVVSVGNFFFNPASISANVGDTMRWVWVAGFHTTTSLTVPPGAAIWDAPITSSSQTYEYKITVAGSYTYDCKIHGLGMSGSFTAANVTPTLAVAPSNQNVSAASGSTSFGVISNSTWTTSSNAVWCSVTSGGTGNGTITANYLSNPDVSQRVASIVVTVPAIPSQTVTVTQAGSPQLQASATATPASIIAGQSSQLDISPTGGTGTYSYSWTSVPAGFTSTLKNPIVTPAITTVYSCMVMSGAQMVNPTTSVTVNPAPPATLILQNNTIINGQSFCYNASQTITVGGDGNLFDIENGGIATMIAGQNILFLPGTLVNSGGNLNAYITVNGPYCTPAAAPAILSHVKQVEIQGQATTTIFRVFPNPTSGDFMIEQNGSLSGSPIAVDVIGTLGETAISERLSGEFSHRFSLAGKPAGIYYIRLIFDGSTDVLKLVKQ